MALKLVDLVKASRGFAGMSDEDPAIVLGAGFGTGMVNTIPRGKVLVLAKGEKTLSMKVKISGQPEDRKTFAVLAFELKADGTPDEDKHHILYVGSMFRQIDPVGKRETPEFTYPTDTKATKSTHELLELMKEQQLKFKFDEKPVTWDIHLRNARPDGTKVVEGSATKWNWV